MTRHDLKLATIANIVAWLRKRNFHDSADAMTAARQTFDHMPASIVVAACLIAEDDADASFWNRMDGFVTAAGDITEADLDAIPF